MLQQREQRCWFLEDGILALHFGLNRFGKEKNRAEISRFEPVFGSVRFGSKAKNNNNRFGCLFWSKTGPNRKYSALVPTTCLVSPKLAFRGNFKFFSNYIMALNLVSNKFPFLLASCDFYIESMNCCWYIVVNKRIDKYFFFNFEDAIRVFFL